MPALVLKLDLSIDGYLAPEDGDVSWIGPVFEDEELAAFELAVLRSAGVHIMGRGAYEAMASHWMQSDEVFAPPMNDTPKVVFSSALHDPEWQGTTVARGDLVAEITRLKASAPGPVLCHGGSRFAGALAAAGLVDEYLLFQHPRALATGLPLFREPVLLRRTETRSFAPGVVASRFVPV
jgi:dihydrofolate reductase